MTQNDAIDAGLIDAQHAMYQSRNPTRRWIHCTRRDWIIDAIRRYRSNPPLKAMEVGPGSCVYLPELARNFQEVVAMDVETTYLNNASRLIEQNPNKYGNVTLCLDNISASRLESGQFDLILCTEVIEHIPDSRAAVMELARLLKPAGVLVLSTPQRYSILELTAKIAFLPGIVNLVRLIYREPVVDNEHINLLTAQAVCEQLSAAGFTIIETYRSGLYIPLVAEFMGQPGQRLIAWLEAKLRGGPFKGLLWTQYYIAQTTASTQ